MSSFWKRWYLLVFGSVFCVVKMNQSYSIQKKLYSTFTNLDNTFIFRGIKMCVLRICTTSIGWWNNCFGGGGGVGGHIYNCDATVTDNVKINNKSCSKDKCFISATLPDMLSIRNTPYIRYRGWYPPDEIFREMDVIDVRQIFVKNLLAFMYTNSDSLLPAQLHLVTHAHNTRFSSAFWIITPSTTNTLTCTKSYHLAHILWKKHKKRT